MTTSRAGRRLSPVHRIGRPGRATRFLLAALALSAGTYVLEPILRPPPALPAPKAVQIPGDTAPLDAGSGPTTPVAGGDRLPLDQRIAFWTARAQRRPDDFLSLVQLALVHAEHARLVADLGEFEQAMGLIGRSIAIVPAYPPTIRARASIRYAIHDFAGAQADARTVLAAMPTDPSALAVLGDAAVELGRPQDAQVAYDRLAVLAPGPWLDVRRARLAYATRDPARAATLADGAWSVAAADPDTEPTDAGFYAFAAGEFDRLAGRPAAARQAYEAALAIRPGDLGALVGLARIDAFDGRMAEALAELRRAAAIAPQPDTMAILGDLEAQTGDAAGAAREAKTLRAIEQLGRIEGIVYDRVLLRFELDHGAASDALLAEARTSAAARPDPIGYDLVAWSLHRLGRDSEASREIARALASEPDDARLLFHAGAIAFALGDPAAGAMFRRALDLGPALDPIERAEASRLLGG